jgi:hypothetical protein
MLTDYEQEELMRQFPKIKLFYETNISKIICNYEYYLAIPYGIKCFMWFTEYKNQNVCILLEIAPNSQINNIKIVNCCFHNHLSYGTIFYGIKQEKSQHFFLLDILQYKGRDYCNTFFHKNLFTFKNIFQNEIKQINYSNNIIIIGLPIITKNYNDLLSIIVTLPYKIAYIQSINGNKRYNLFDINNVSIPINNIPINNHVIQKKLSNIFKVRAEIQNDIYTIEQGDFIDTAYIPSYTTSVYMNNLFRNIKENNNLDALEESDSDDEFENDKIDKFVNLERSYNMECKFSHKFKKWIPIKVV